VTKIEDIFTLCKEKGKRIIAVACAEDTEVLKAVEKAREIGLIEAILIGNSEEINSLLKNLGIKEQNYEIIDERDVKKAALIAAKLVSEGKAQILMKGLIGTADFLKAVLNKEMGLRTGRVLSHIGLFETKNYHKLLLVSDSAMNIAPDLETKKNILENVVRVGRSLGVEKPKVACITAVEKVNPKMTCTLDAKTLVDLNMANEIDNCVIGGPFALDNAISKEAAEHKGIVHPVAGDADILLMPNIESGNVLYKSLVFLSKAKVAGVIAGSKAPIVLTSRADSDEAKLSSIALAVATEGRI